MLNLAWSLPAHSLKVKAGSAMNHDSPDLTASRMIGERYEVGHRLREEPWGEVWLARDHLLKEEVALKVLARDAAEWGTAQSYYEQEAVLALKLRHPLILGVFHLEHTEPCLFLVQEPFAGESLLAQFTRKQRFSLPQALQLLEQISQTMAFAHQRGAVHQALNPLNLLLQGEEIRVANFAFPPDGGDQVTTLELKAYDAPEVIYGDTPTTSSNIFSLGVLGFRLMAGSLPYALTFDEPFPYRLETLPADLDEIPLPLQNLLIRCLSVDPEERFPDLATFLAQLRQMREIQSSGRPAEYQSWQPEKPESAWKPVAAKARALLGTLWQSGQPLLHKAKESALQAWRAFLASPRRQLWGLGVVVAAVIAIVLAIKLNRPIPELSKPAPAPRAAMQLPVAAGGGPPLTETSKPAAAPGQPGGAPALGPASTPAPRAASEAAKPREGRYLLVAATYAHQKQARALQQRLRKGKIKAKIVSRKRGAKTLYQVQIGPVNGAQAAKDLAQRLKSQEKITPRIVKMTAKTSTKSTTKTKKKHKHKGKSRSTATAAAHGRASR
jgi:cell division septation protein DedD